MTSLATVTARMGDAAPRRLRARAPHPVLIYWMFFAGSALAHISEYLIGDLAAPVTLFLATVSCVTCGFGWLLARSIFRENGQVEPWAIGVVAALFALVVFVDYAILFGWGEAAGVKMVRSIASLLSSTVLILTLLEAIQGFRSETTGAERRFRTAFLAGYCSILFTGVALFQSQIDWPLLAVWQAPVQALCALIAVGGATAAAWYRLGHPLTEGKPRRGAVAPNDDEVDPHIVSAVQGLLEEEHLYRDPALRVADLATRLGQPEYKVSRAITRGLGASNFNQLINRHCIDDSKRRLHDRANDDLSILVIAMDSGFASIGPFNRTFKQLVGTTPGAFRAASKQAD